jgi:hypothetical protein
VPWWWIEDETRNLHSIRTAPTVADYLRESVQRALLDRWGGKPPPLILCESRSLAGVLRDLADRYACPIASTNGQTRGFLVNDIVPELEVGQRVLYLGDWDHCGHQIETATRSTLIEHGGAAGLLLRTAGIRNPDAPTRRGRNHAGLWERVSLTDRQVAMVNEERRQAGLPDATILKVNNRYKPAPTFPAIETEAFGQARIVEALRTRLDALMPEPIGDVLERQEQQRAQVAEQ